MGSAAHFNVGGQVVLRSHDLADVVGVQGAEGVAAVQHGIQDDAARPDVRFLRPEAGLQVLRMGL